MFTSLRRAVAVLVTYAVLMIGSPAVSTPWRIGWLQMSAWGER